MDPVSVVLAALVAVGLVAVVGGALVDRDRRRRRAAALAGPPDRAIPHLPAGASPVYLSETEARRTPAGAAPTALDEVERARWRKRLNGDGDADGRGVVVVGAGWSDRAYVTDETAGWAVLEEPYVLVCDDPVDSVRELLPAMERAGREAAALVVVAPAAAAEVRSTLEVNRLQRRLRVLLVLAGDRERAEVAGASGATALTLADRRSGWLPPEALGRCAWWVADARRSHLRAT